MATDEQIRRLVGFGVSGKLAASVSDDEALDLILLIRRWIRAHRATDEQVGNWNDAYAELDIAIEPETRTAVTLDLLAEALPGLLGEWQRRRRHSKNLRSPGVRYVSSRRAWVQAIQVQGFNCLDLLFAHPWVQATTDKGDVFVSIWGGSLEQVQERVEEFRQAVEAPGDRKAALAALKLRYREQAREDERRFEQWASRIAKARKAQSREEWEGILSTIRQEMLAAGHLFADEWIAQQTNEFLHGRPLWKESVPCFRPIGDEKQG